MEIIEFFFLSSLALCQCTVLRTNFQYVSVLNLDVCVCVLYLAGNEQLRDILFGLHLLQGVP